jgi:5-methylcytosine-specific restriction enzyme A
LILALSLYIAHRPRLPSKGGPEVTALSKVLNRLHRAGGEEGRPDLRNPAGCYMKLQNFRRFDPDYTAEGKKGLKAGNKEEGPVWDTFAADPARLHATAAAIEAAIMGTDGPPLPADPAEDDPAETEAPEGRVLTRLHRFRERSRKLVEQRKASALNAGKGLACEACGFDFAARYGQRGAGFIECHHTRPVHTLRPGETTRLSDLALLCANCHRMIHSARPWLTVEELREVLLPVQSASPNGAAERPA